MSPDPDTFLERLLSGELDPQAPEVRERLAVDPDLRERYDEFVEVAKRLDLAEVRIVVDLSGRQLHPGDRYRRVRAIEHRDL